MKEFIRKYEDRIHGVLTCFDRMLLRGYLPIMSGWAMAQCLDRLNQGFSSLKQFLLETSERVKNHAVAMAKKQGRPFQYLASNIKKDEAARELARRDEIPHGLVCIYSIPGTLPHLLVYLHQEGATESTNIRKISGGCPIGTGEMGPLECRSLTIYVTFPRWKDRRAAGTGDSDAGVRRNGLPSREPIR